MITCELHKRFIERMKERRIALGITQAEAARRIGWKQSQWANTELGRNDPTTNTITLVSQALGVDADDLIAKHAEATA